MGEGLGAEVDTIVLPDLRGHGNSGGGRGNLGGPRTVIADLHTFVEFGRSLGGETLYVGGESMGGLLALAYVSEHPEGVAGLALVAPALQLNVKRTMSREALDRTLRDLRAGRTGIPVTGELPSDPKRNPDFVRNSLTDPLVLPTVGMRYLLTLYSFMAFWSMRYPQRLARRDLPVIVLQGDADVVLRPQASRELSRLVPQAEFHSFPRAWHNLFWDPDGPEAFAVLREWFAREGARDGSSADECEHP
jgi:alpha-beta hydrolase superfamily lysophospholipase